jgi:hypothetical protein
MPFESNKPLKKCGVCGKEVHNLGLHVTNNHPQILAQLDESAPALPAKLDYGSNSGVIAQNKPSVGSINDLIREKLDVMMNIKIIEMLSSSKSPDLQQLSAALNPPQKTTIQELKEFHDLVYPKERESSGEGAGWIDVINNALPIVAQMIPARRAEVVKNEFGANENGSIQLLKPIQDEVTGDPAKSGGFSEESGDLSKRSE